MGEDIANTGGPGSRPAEPSMEEILATIRRTLNDDQAPVALDEDVLVLDASMMARPADPASGTAPPAAAEAADGAYLQGRHIASESSLSTGSLVTKPEAMYIQPDQPEPPMSDIEPPETLIGAEASDATKSSIGALVRSLGAERSVLVSRAGVTIEDIVREEIRPMLKSWLDTHLPSLVERIVRSEIERVVDRTQL